MISVFFVRHQAAGVMHSHPFAAAPTDEQKAAIARLCFQTYGEKHPKTGEPYWLLTVEVPLLGADDVPSVPERSLSVASVAGMNEVTVSGKGEVSPAGA